MRQTESSPPYRPSVSRTLCPPWCVTAHGLHAGEEDWVHTSEPVPITDQVSARLCVTIDPRTRRPEEPVVMIGEEEHRLDDVSGLGDAIGGLVELGRAATAPPRA